MQVGDDATVDDGAGSVERSRFEIELSLANFFSCEREYGNGDEVGANRERFEGFEKRIRFECREEIRVLARGASED